MNYKDARGGADVKTILAVVFAVGGLSWAGYSAMSGGNKTKSDGPRVIASALDDEGNAVDTSYTKASNTKQIDKVGTEIETAIREQAQAALSAIEVPKGLPDGVSDATLNAFLPLLSGDHSSFIDAIAAMGGEVPGDLEGDHPMFKHLSGVFEHAKVDLSRITVERFVSTGERRMGMRREVQQTDDVEIAPGDRPGEHPQGGMQSQVMEMQPGSIFPDAPPKSDPTAIEIKIPVQPAGEKNEKTFALILTWNKASKQWQPAAYRIIQNMLMEDG